VAFLFCLIAKHVVSEAPSNNFPACHFEKKRNESLCTPFTHASVGGFSDDIAANGKAVAGYALDNMSHAHTF